MDAGAGPHRTELQAWRAGEARHLPAVLSLIAGMADVTSWLTLGGLFSAHITGNLVIMAADLVRGGSPSAAQVLAVPVFVVAVALAGQVARICHAAEYRCVRLLLLAQFALLACAFGVSASHRGPYGTHGWLDIAVGIFAVAAMGVQNALLHLAPKRAHNGRDDRERGGRHAVADGTAGGRLAGTPPAVARDLAPARRVPRGLHLGRCVGQDGRNLGLAAASPRVPGCASRTPIRCAGRGCGDGFAAEVATRRTRCGHTCWWSWRQSRHPTGKRGETTRT